MAPKRRSKILKLLPSRARKIITSRAASKNSDDKSSVANPFPFLQLPAEVRIQIYKQLGPISKPNSKKFLVITRGHLRRDPELVTYTTKRCSEEDESRCYPEILCLNRQIYHEAMPLWYGADKLHFWLISPASRFHKKTSLPRHLPDFLRFMTSLRIDIFTEDDDTSLALKSRRPKMSKFLTEFGNRLAEHGNLKELHIRFSLRTPIPLPPSAVPSLVLGSLLEPYLEPFRGTSGLLNLTTSIDVREAHESNQINCGGRIYSSVEEDARAYLDTFESEMLQTTKSIH
ncbi:uncharacterized protein EAF02_001359 [Botrytis sinoallii]|uniref:uncharacterized protein n=1 Tax=Botrytis sinoallii TaxID=1463999 RepID=UPI0019017CBB|nr:uncharacterized protein EAF02_001359 [Botrytis sinoallii]KAF7891034.1 hypothetical protein EAF02_001359 [Botrytis sinoallii]